jgi:regulator of protease activity HflC (stomatin/prohibitin superfamily)
MEIGLNQVSLLTEKGGEVRTKGQLVSQNVALEQLNRQVLADQAQQRMDYIEQQEAAAPASKLFSRSSYEGYGAQAPAPDAAGKPMVQQQAATAVLSFNQQVSFPSRDGFDISLDMTVEFELLPENIAWVLQSYGDLPAVVENIIMPQILSVSRLKGSAYGAKDFIVGEGREKFQNDLTDTLAKTLNEKKIIIHNALIRHVNVPMQILDPIQQASVAVQQDLTNKEMQNTARKQAELNTELSLIEQRGQQVAQETEKMKAETKADQEKQVAETRANALKQVAEVEKQTAMVRADKTRKLGEAQANVVTMVDGEKARGFELKAKAFGDPTAYTMWEFANSLNSDVKITVLHAGAGTLWTDIERASLGQLGGAAVIEGK